MSQQLNKVSKAECMDAIDFLFTSGYSTEMTSDKRYYTEILLKKVANDYNMKLVFDEDA
tara:strand:+ start:488 stop:664 length:177 start_codon:yes stop_codon:yes gene_type:complete